MFASTNSVILTCNIIHRSAVFCSRDLGAYKSLGFYDNFGAALGARNAGLVPLEKIRARGEKGLKEMQDSVKNFGKVSPIGLVSGRPFAIEDAKVRVSHVCFHLCMRALVQHTLGRVGEKEHERRRFFIKHIFSTFDFSISLWVSRLFSLSGCHTVGRSACAGWRQGSFCTS